MGRLDPTALPESPLDRLIAEYVPWDAVAELGRGLGERQALAQEGTLGVGAGHGLAALEAPEGFRDALLLGRVHGEHSRRLSLIGIGEKEPGQSNNEDERAD